MSSNGNAPAARLKKTELFEPLNIRGLQLQNHIVVAPMGMYSSPGGHLTDFHLMHHGQFALRGVGLTMVEVTAVTANGRSSPLDAGIWDDSHIPSFRKVVDFVHGIEGGNGRIAIQLGHAGRRGSMMPVYPGKKLKVAFKQDDGWEDEVWGASPVPFSDMFVVPKEMSLAQVKAVVDAFGDAAERSVKAGFDAIEVHAAHGYLLSSFLCPFSNSRTDSYGGSFENRIRFLLEVVDSIRRRVPDSMPLFIRISATDWMEHSPETPQWTIQDSIKLSIILSDLGVDVIDVSSGANNPAQKIILDNYYQINLAEEIKKALKGAGKEMLVAAVGLITNAAVAEEVLQNKKADMVLVGREFLRDPNVVHKWAYELGTKKEWPRQYVRAGPKGSPF